MQEFNHSIEYTDGHCNFCLEPCGIKLIGVNRQVCLDCNKAQCIKCNCEVSPDPELGCLHYSPDAGFRLQFLPDYCPLYSIPSFPRFSALNFVTNRRDCKLCTQLKHDYPEYEIFVESENESMMREDGWGYERMKISKYTCNLCGSKFSFVCEFDSHIRSHTKYGKNIAVLGLVGENLDQS